MALLITLHVASAVLWLGNFAVTGVWALRAFMSRDRTLAAFAAREILFTDATFTLIFGSAVVVTGLVLAQRLHIDVATTRWIREALIAVIACGVVWAIVLVPIELRLFVRTKQGLPAGRLFAAWNVIGWSVTAVLFAVIYLMIAKPV
ncbi:MAG TPA: DUF2269 family protein [Candidatus Tumulicola sp.]|jgi:uncharacterized membrane protein